MTRPTLRPLAALLISLCASSAAAEIVYRETFPFYRDPSRYTRIAQASDAWEVRTDSEGERYLRVTFRFTPERLRGLVVWDLAPIQFTSLQIQAKTPVSDLRLSAVLFDRFGSSYELTTVPPSGKKVRQLPLPPDEWITYQANLPADISRLRERGKEVSPFVHAPGEDLVRWEHIDFTNRAYSTIHFSIACRPNFSPMGEPVTVDFKLLEMSNPKPKQ